MNGVLWYYQASWNTAEPFRPRVRIGAGWNIYTSVVGTGTQAAFPGQGDGLVARDK
ncbi:hypothetical protein [Actinacidiphila rubida]|uniref:Uncharacterized protein n=1 Tax=Actinacidiphila rubida TaxID=310780 RepID=A0A1H8GAS5_9ACTN|nr:hypothetical protein [Actinacidiphila rubida]SEN41251.1 hypothetical protein SAMN05216267_10052 [Actinacidiphila rubida]